MQGWRTFAHSQSSSNNSPEFSLHSASEHTPPGEQQPSRFLLALKYNNREEQRTLWNGTKKMCVCEKKLVMDNLSWSLQRNVHGLVQEWNKNKGEEVKDEEDNEKKRRSIKRMRRTTRNQQNRLHTFFLELDGLCHFLKHQTKTIMRNRRRRDGSSRQQHVRTWKVTLGISPHRLSAQSREPARRRRQSHVCVSVWVTRKTFCNQHWIR